MNNKPTSVAAWLERAKTQLEDSSSTTSARLDAELILAHSLNRSRTWLHAHSDDVIDTKLLVIADACLTLRIEHVPIAYIIGHKEFYGRRFHVTPATLIPRPESETILSLLDKFSSALHTTLLDVGTGSGCLGITAKLEYPRLEVTLCDISLEALEIARTNARQLMAAVNFVQSDLLADISGTFDLILANLPYVDRTWETSPDVAHEPALALYAADGGLELIKQLLNQSLAHLNTNGLVLLEADPCQHDEIVQFAEDLGYRHEVTDDYIVTLSFKK